MRRRVLALAAILVTLGSLGAGAARAASPDARLTTDERPWACVGENDINVGVCLYSPVPPAPGS